MVLLLLMGFFKMIMNKIITENMIIGNSQIKGNITFFVKSFLDNWSADKTISCELSKDDINKLIQELKEFLE